MAHTNLKHYLDKELNTKHFVESHFSHGDVDFIDESTVGPLKQLHDIFSSGLVKGNTLLEMNVGGMIYPLFSASNIFKEIYVMDCTEASVKHFMQWLEKGHEATDWSFASKYVCQLEGNKDGWEEKEEQVRRAVKGVFKYDLFDTASNNLLVIPQMDCVVTVFLFNVISKTKEDFKKHLKNLTSWLKIDGHLVLFLTLNMTFYRVGDHKFHTLTVNEKCVREVVTNAGFVIEKEEVFSTSVKSDLVDYKNMFFLVARKVKNA